MCWLLSHVRLLAAPWTAARQASPSYTSSCSLLKLMSIKSVMPSNHLILCHPFLFLPSIFSVRWLFTSGGHSIGASASVLPANIQGWFPLVLTGLISLLSKGLSRVFSSPLVQKHQFFSAQPSLWSNSHIRTWPFHSSELNLMVASHCWENGETWSRRVCHSHNFQQQKYKHRFSAVIHFSLCIV